MKQRKLLTSLFLAATLSISLLTGCEIQAVAHLKQSKQKTVLQKNRLQAYRRKVKLMRIRMQQISFYAI